MSFSEINALGYSGLALFVLGVPVILILAVRSFWLGRRFLALKYLAFSFLLATCSVGICYCAHLLMSRLFLAQIELEFDMGAPATRPRPKTKSEPDFSYYPLTVGVKGVIDMYVNDSGFNVHRSALVAISNMLGGGAAHIQSVAQSGREWETTVVFNFAAEGGGARQLSNEEIDAVRSAIHELPTENAFPPIERLGFVSYLDDTNWVTRSFDQQKPPKALKKIQDIIAGATVVSLAELNAESRGSKGVPK